MFAVCSAQVPARRFLPHPALQRPAVLFFTASLVSLPGTHIRAWHPDIHEQHHRFLAMEQKSGQRGSCWRLSVHHQGNELR